MSTTNQLLETLIKSNTSLSDNVSGLAESVNSLVVIDAARAEREKNQEEKNKRYDDFIKTNSEPLTRLRRWQLRVDKSGDKIFLGVIIALGALLGVNYLV